MRYVLQLGPNNRLMYMSGGQRQPVVFKRKRDAQQAVSIYPGSKPVAVRKVVKRGR